ncbi:MAG: AzlC family ABC transporter permease [Syntrophomonadaceae bacterium]|nr:AzlC family ABC transporter permease [Syntrophomonadaceae bacterium]
MRQQYLAGMASAVPIVMGYFPIGFAYGVLAKGAGLTIYETGLMSLMVYAGASQFIAVGLLAINASFATIILTTFLVNLRHLLMGAALAPYFTKVKSSCLAVLAYGITDETFAVASARYAKQAAHPAFQLGLNLTTYGAWFFASIIGATAGGFLPASARFALDFALPAMYIALLVLQLSNKPAYLAALAGGAVSVLLAWSMPGNWNIIIAALVAATAGVWSEKWIKS